MRPIVTRGTCSPAPGYVRNLSREADPLAHDPVNEHSTVEGETINRNDEQETSYPGRCAVSRPEIGDLLPVDDEYPGWRVETSLDPIEEKG